MPTTTTVAKRTPASVVDDITDRYHAQPEVSREELHGLVTFEFAPEITEAERENTYTEMAAAIRYWRDHPVPVNVTVGRTDTWMVDAYLAAFAGSARGDAERIFSTEEPQNGIAGPGVIVQQLGSARVGGVLPHEYTHVVQYALSGRRGDQMDPCWMTEGAADLYRFAIADAADLYGGKPQRRLYAQPKWIDGPGIRDLTCDRFGYLTGALAVEYLVFLYGEPALISYFETYQYDVDWEDAFVQAFGVTVDEFSADFETYRATL